MSEHGIWWDETYNPFRGCSPKSAGCAHCWAAMMAHRMGWEGGLVFRPNDITGMPESDGLRDAGWGHGLTDERGRFNGVTRVIPELLGIPLRWRKPRVVFVNSTSDTHHEGFTFEERCCVYGVACACPQHTFVILTKRPEERLQFYADLSSDKFGYGDPLEALHVCLTSEIDLDEFDYELQDTWPLPNVIEGVSIEDQPTADERIPLLLQTPAARRMVSYEPGLGPVDLRPYLPFEGGLFGTGARELNLDYVISGGESGHGARPSDVQWHRDVARQCEDAGVRYGLKQLGALPFDEDGRGWAFEYLLKRQENCYFRLRDAKGSDPREWPEDLRRYAITGPREFWGI